MFDRLNTSTCDEPFETFLGTVECYTNKSDVGVLLCERCDRRRFSLATSSPRGPEPENVILSAELVEIQLTSADETHNTRSNLWRRRGRRRNGGRFADRFCCGVRRCC